MIISIFKLYLQYYKTFNYLLNLARHILTVCFDIFDGRSLHFLPNTFSKIFSRHLINAPSLTDALIDHNLFIDALSIKRLLSNKRPSVLGRFTDIDHLIENLLIQRFIYSSWNCQKGRRYRGVGFLLSFTLQTLVNCYLYNRNHNIEQ